VGFHHVNTRRNVDQLLFVDDADRLQFLAKLEQTVFRNRWLCHGFCLMSNHYHLLIETPEHNLGAGMLLLNGMYARYFNWRQETVGHVFQGPYHDEPVRDDGHLLETCRYIVLNPVRAGLARRPFDWRWSSYRATAGLARRPPFLQVDLVRGLFQSPGGFADFCNQVAEQPGCK
jgi:putative transposase